MTTNDTIILLASGATATADHPPSGSAGGVAGTVVEIDKQTDRESYEIFKEELMAFATDLTKLVVRDGEDATKFVTVRVDVSYYNQFFKLPRK
jgi:glutamate N-acetyltransferase/amino-acid N-acetyltransferase